MSTCIEAETIVAAAPADVWAALLEHERWAAWAASTDPAALGRRMTLDAVELVDGPADQVGALRCATATVAVPLLGRRAVRWVEQVTDVAAPWTIEYEALAHHPIRGWRLRLWLVEQGDGSTRLRCRLTYTPATLQLKLANTLFLHRAIAAQVQATLDGLARSFMPEAEAVLPASDSAGDSDEEVESAVLPSDSSASVAA